MTGYPLRVARFSLSIAALVVLWALIVELAHPRYLPTPWAVGAFVASDLVHGHMLYAIGMTLWRSIAGFFLAMIVGCSLGLVFGRSTRADEAFMPWVLWLMNTPVLVIAALCYIWFGLNDPSAILVVALAKFPNNTVILRDGVRTFDPGLDDIAAIYRFPFMTRFREILLPQAMPFLIVAARSGIGIVWKIVLVAEFFGLSSGVGREISDYFSRFAIKEIMGYSVAFSLVMLTIELVILQPLDDYARRWRFTPLLEVDIRRKARGHGTAPVEIIEGLAFTVTRGCVTCLFGPSGCGKSTTLRIIMGLDPAFEGRIEPPTSGLHLGVVFQDPRLLPWRTVEENVRLAAPRIRPEALDALLAELGLADWSRHRPNQLSLGMQRRVALARALAVEPDLLVLDEAFVSLDERAADSLRAVVFAAIERRRATVLMVTHNIGEALRFSDTILVLAPRPTRVLDAVALDTPRASRDEAWFAREKGHLADTDPRIFR